MKFTNTYRYVVLKQVMFLILFLIILVCMIKIDLEYLKQEVLIVFAFVIYFAIKIGLFFIDRLCGVQKEKMQYHSMKAVYDERGRKVNSVIGEPVFIINFQMLNCVIPKMIWYGKILLQSIYGQKPKKFRIVISGKELVEYAEKKVATVYYFKRSRIIEKIVFDERK